MFHTLVKWIAPERKPCSTRSWSSPAGSCGRSSSCRCTSRRICRFSRWLQSTTKSAPMSFQSAAARATRLLPAWCRHLRRTSPTLECGDRLSLKSKEPYWCATPRQASPVEIRPFAGPIRRTGASRQAFRTLPRLHKYNRFAGLDVVPVRWGEVVGPLPHQRLFYDETEAKKKTTAVSIRRSPIKRRG